jgi:hypothetical protein
VVNPNRFYTYAYLREDRTPYYIGKGTGRRIYIKRKDGVNRPKDKSRVIFLKQNLTEEEAFKHEKYMIAVFGRKDLGTGILHNRTDGGEGTSGAKHSEKTKEKIRAANKGKKHSEEHKANVIAARIGKKHSDETKAKMSAAAKNKPSVSEKTREKMKEAAKNRPAISEETRKKMSTAQIGNTNTLGYKQTEETKAKRSAALKGKKRKPFTEETKARISAAKKGKKRKPFTEETRKKMSTAQIGNTNGQKKHNKSEE